MFQKILYIFAQVGCYFWTEERVRISSVYSLSDPPCLCSSGSGPLGTGLPLVGRATAGLQKKCNSTYIARYDFICRGFFRHIWDVQRIFLFAIKTLQFLNAYLKEFSLDSQHIFPFSQIFQWQFSTKIFWITLTQYIIQWTFLCSK